MCGIAGMYRFKNNDLQRDYFSWCLTTMKRRGPDGQGIWQNDKNYITAFTRLAIRDLSANGDQPMLSDDGNYCISFNGEVYNVDELKQTLKPYRLSYRSTSDTEVLLYALIHLGNETTLSLVDGMFAFAFYDLRENKLILARDRMGIKPLYVGLSDEGVVYSSQYDHIINHSFFKQECMDEAAMASYLFLGYMSDGSGIINKTKLLPHGTYMTVSDNTVNIFDYYSYAPAASNNIADIEEVLGCSVHKQLVSDVSTGSFMSGGVDSTLVTWFANKHAHFSSFTLGIDDERMNEATKAAEFAGIFKMPHYSKYISASELLPLLKENAIAFTEPFADYSSLPMLVLSAFAKKEITVALSGDGGDELFWGYNRSVKALGLVSLYEKNVYRRRLDLVSTKIKTPGKVDIARHWDRENFLEYYYSTLGITGALHWLPKIFKAKPATALFYLQCFHLNKKNNSTEALMNAVRELEINIHLQRILLKVDRAAMHYSLEVRVPFLSNAMLDYSASCRYTDCIKEGQGKMNVKNALIKKTNAGLVLQPKKGFTVPMDNWIRNEIRNEVSEKIMDMPAHLSVFFDRKKLTQLLSGHQAKNQNTGWFIWAIYAFVCWDQMHRNKYSRCA